MKTVKINGQDFKVKYTIRALFIFEQITKKTFKIDSLMDNYIFFFSILLANNPDNKLSWDEFCDALDADPSIFVKMSEIIVEEQKKQEVFMSEEEKEDNEKKS